MWCSAAVLALSGPALALDAQDFAAKLTANQAPGDTISFSEATADGDTITLSGASIALSDESSLPLGDIVFRGVSALENGGYRTETASVAAIDMTEDESRLQIANVEIQGLTIPGTVVAGQSDRIASYDSARIGPVTISYQGKAVASTQAIMVELDRDGAVVETDAAVTGFTMDLGIVDDPRSRALIDALGYQTLNGEMTVNSLWDMEGGDLSVRETTLNLVDVGRLDLAFDISGYDLAFDQALEQAQASMSAGGANEMAGMAMLGLLQQLSLNSARLRFDDQSVTQKALDYVGGQQGIDGTQMAQAIKGMLPLFLGQLRNPAFQTQVASAVNAYLDDPQSLTIDIAPANPLPFATLMGTGMGAPETLPDVLGVTVTANQ
jgi:uncharacterized glyoxalase superfamily protein PhnB